jgi:MoaA/NifB/PqqE/SkfB family radical SAM enzyme
MSSSTNDRGATSLTVYRKRVLQVLRIATSLARYKAKSPRPFFVSYQVTLRCNLRCMFCDAWRTKTFEELNTLQAMKIVEELADSGVSILGITGGEPLMRKDLEEIATYARRRDIIVGVNTNGTLLTPKRARSVADAFDAVFVSLDGFEKTHDAIRGEEGAFRKALTGLNNLLGARLDCTVGVNLVLNKMNYREFIPFSNWIKDIGVPLTFFPVAGDDNFVSAYSVPKNEIDEFIRAVLRQKAANPYLGPSEKIIRLIPKFVKGEMPLICDAGRLYLGVSPRGELRICPIGPNSPDWKIGSLLTSSLTELMNTSRFHQVLEARKHCTPCLAGCTTPYSLLFRGSVKDLAEEALTYYKAIRNN